MLYCHVTYIYYPSQSNLCDIAFTATWIISGVKLGCMVWHGYFTRRQDDNIDVIVYVRHKVLICISLGFDRCIQPIVQKPKDCGHKPRIGLFKVEIPIYMYTKF